MSSNEIRIRNRIGWHERLAQLRGSSVTFDLRGYEEPLAEITRLGRELSGLSDDELKRRTSELRHRTRSGTASLDVRRVIFALVRELSTRAIGLRPFDVQVVAALALDAGAIVEMQTGEGKTLAAVMPAALAALPGRGAHVLTFNDYLARRDAEWMGPIYACSACRSDSCSRA